MYYSFLCTELYPFIGSQNDVAPATLDLWGKNVVMEFRPSIFDCVCMCVHEHLDACLYVVRSYCE